MKKVTVYNGMWRGAHVSMYGMENGYIDYACLADTFDAVLCNDIISQTWECCGEWEQISGFYDDPDDPDNEYYPEIFQYYIVDSNGADTLGECNEIVFYNDNLDLYVWGVTHFGTAWTHVLTNIEIEKGVD